MSKESVGILFLALFSLLLLFVTSFTAKTTTKIIVNKYESDIFAQSNCIYVIKSTVDLGGREILLPKECVLSFRHNGKIQNGRLVGNNTKIFNLRKACLGIEVNGTWVCPIIKDIFFDSIKLNDNQILDNIYFLQSRDFDNEISLTKPTYRVVLTNDHRNGLRLKDNVTLKLETTLSVIGNDLTHYAVILAANNSKIIGGTIVGDVGHHKYVEGSTSEWGFGIYVNRSEMVNIMGVRISKCTGDGIYIGGGVVNDVGDYTKASKNIIISDVVSDDNRRQGISITCADGVYIENSIFSNTGMTEFTRPSCGLDIEPNEGQSVRNVTFKKCQFINNNKVMDVSIGGYVFDGDKCNIEKILLEDCIVSGSLIIQSGSVILKRCGMKTLNIQLNKMPKDKVVLEGCRISGGSGVTVRSLGKTTDDVNALIYTFKNCSLGIDDVLTHGMFSMINHKGDEVGYFIIEDCEFEYPKGSQKYDLVQEHMTCSFNFNNCCIVPNGRTLDLSNKIYEGCWISD